MPRRSAKGAGVQQDLPRAAELFTAAAKQGHSGRSASSGRLPRVTCWWWLHVRLRYDHIRPLLRLGCSTNRGTAGACVYLTVVGASQLRAGCSRLHLI